jgi:peptidyl-prolyl cis-trans isomerase SurA
MRFIRTHSWLLIVALFAGSARAELINGINVIVNDAVITYDQVEGSIAPLVELLVRQYNNQPQVLKEKVENTRSEKIEQLVQRELILFDFKTAGYNLPETFVEDYVNDQVRKQFGDRVTLIKSLKKFGMTYETFRKQKREDLIVRLLTQKNISADKVLISPHKIETYYNEHTDEFKVADQIKLRTIVLNKTAETPEGTVRKLADEILKKLEEGASFSEMASIYSDGSQKSQGGDRGWVDRTYFKKELSDPAFALKPGNHSAVIDLPEGCYILFVEDVRSAHVKSLADIREEIEGTLKTREQDRMQKKWISRLKNKAFVRYY